MHIEYNRWKSHRVLLIQKSLTKLVTNLQYTIAMLGYGPEDTNAVMELTYNYGVTEYDKGNAYAQVTLHPIHG